MQYIAVCSKDAIWVLCFEYDFLNFFIKLRHKGMVNTTTVGPCLLDMLILVRGKTEVLEKKTLEAQ